MIHLVNLTPHEILIMGEDGSALRIPPSGQVARAEERVMGTEEILIATTHVSPAECRFSLGGVPFRTLSYGEIVGLPPAEENVVYIVSSIVAMAAAKAGRKDVCFPHELIRDSQGRVVGARALARYA